MALPRKNLYHHNSNSQRSPFPSNRRARPSSSANITSTHNGSANKQSQAPYSLKVSILFFIVLWVYRLFLLVRLIFLLVISVVCNLVLLVITILFKIYEISHIAALYLFIRQHLSTLFTNISYHYQCFCSADYSFSTDSIYNSLSSSSIIPQTLPPSSPKFLYTNSKPSTNSKKRKPVKQINTNLESDDFLFQSSSITPESSSPPPPPYSRFDNGLDIDDELEITLGILDSDSAVAYDSFIIPPTDDKYMIPHFPTPDPPQAISNSNSHADSKKQSVNTLSELANSNSAASLSVSVILETETCLKTCSSSGAAVSEPVAPKKSANSETKVVNDSKVNNTVPLASPNNNTSNVVINKPLKQLQKSLKRTKSDTKKTSKKNKNQFHPKTVSATLDQNDSVSRRKQDAKLHSSNSSGDTTLNSKASVESLPCKQIKIDPTVETISNRTTNISNGNYNNAASSTNGQSSSETNKKNNYNNSSKLVSSFSPSGPSVNNSSHLNGKKQSSVNRRHRHHKSQKSFGSMDISRQWNSHQSTKSMSSPITTVGTTYEENSQNSANPATIKSPAIGLTNKSSAQTETLDDLQSVTYQKSNFVDNYNHRDDDSFDPTVDHPELNGLVDSLLADFDSNDSNVKPGAVPVSNSPSSMANGNTSFSFSPAIWNTNPQFRSNGGHQSTGSMSRLGPNFGSDKCNEEFIASRFSPNISNASISHNRTIPSQPLSAVSSGALGGNSNIPTPSSSLAEFAINSHHNGASSSPNNSIWNPSPFAFQPQLHQFSTVPMGNSNNSDIHNLNRQTTPPISSSSLSPEHIINGTSVDKSTPKISSLRLTGFGSSPNYSRSPSSVPASPILAGGVGDFAANEVNSKRIWAVDTSHHNSNSCPSISFSQENSTSFISSSASITTNDNTNSSAMFDKDIITSSSSFSGRGTMSSASSYASIQNTPPPGLLHMVGAVSTPNAKPVSTMPWASSPNSVAALPLSAPLASSSTSSAQPQASYSNGSQNNSSNMPFFVTPTGNKRLTGNSENMINTTANEEEGSKSINITNSSLKWSIPNHLHHSR